MASVEFKWGNAQGVSVQSTGPLDPEPPSSSEPSWIDKWASTWRGAAIALALIGLSVFALIRWGLPLAADAAAKAMPDVWADKIEVAALEDLDKTLCKPTQLSEARQAQLQSGFQSLKAAESSRVRPADQATLLFRHCPAVGPNAFNLGRKTVVLTDDMVSFATGANLTVTDPALMGILAHELGHLQSDHVIRGLFRNVGVGLLATFLLGDVSGLLAAAPAMVLRNQFTRGFEHEADDSALLRMQAADIPTQPLADLFKKLSVREPRSKEMAWLFSHPASDERAQLFGQ